MELEALTGNVEVCRVSLNPEDQLQELYRRLSGPHINLDLITTFLNENPNILRRNFKEYRGKNVLQIACSNLADNLFTPENIPVLETLANGTNLLYANKKENYKEVIHYAALSGRPEILRTIIDVIKNKVNSKRISATTSDGETALSLLLKRKNPGKFIECIRILIDAGIDVDSSDDTNATPILLAFKKYGNYLQQKNREGMAAICEILQLLVGANCDLDSHRLNKKTARTYFSEYRFRIGNVILGEPPENRVRNHEELFGLLKENREDDFLQHPNLQRYVKHTDGTFTLLQLACKNGLSKAVKALLNLGANANVKTDKNCLPVEIAGRKGFYDIFAIVLAKTKSIPPSLVVEIAKNLHQTPTCKINHEKCLGLLLQQKRVRVCVNTPDEDGYTALHCATKLRKPDASLSLLKAGARLSAKDNEGNMPIEEIDIGTLEHYFNYCIYYKNKRVYNNPWVTEEDKKIEKDIEINYTNLLPLNKSSASHIEVFKKISEMSELNSILKHPLVSSYLYLKWHQVRWMYYLNILIFALYGFLLYLYIFFYYLNGSRPPIIVNIALGFVTFCLVVRELVQFLCRWRRYDMEFKHCLELILFALTYVIISETPSDLTIRKQIAALTILLSAHELVLSLGQLPSCATNVEMLKTVSWNFFTFLAWYFVLLLGFALSFYILFHTEEHQSSNNDDGDDDEDGVDFYQSLTLSIVKTVVMLTGEFDASSFKFELYPITSVIIFLTFVFMITMVVFNLLNGLAITDIQQIRSDAQIVANRSRLRHMQILEVLYTMFYCTQHRFRVDYLRDFFYEFIYSESEFCKEGLVHVNKCGYVLKQERKKAGAFGDWIWGENRMRLDAETVDNIIFLLDVTKMEDRKMQERKLIRNQMELEVKQEKIWEEQKEIVNRLGSLEQEVKSLHALLKDHLTSLSQQETVSDVHDDE